MEGHPSRLLVAIPQQPVNPSAVQPVCLLEDKQLDFAISYHAAVCGACKMKPMSCTRCQRPYTHSFVTTATSPLVVVSLERHVEVLSQLPCSRIRMSRGTHHAMLQKCSMKGGQNSLMATIATSNPPNAGESAANLPLHLQSPLTETCLIAALYAILHCLSFAVANVSTVHSEQASFFVPTN